MDFPVLGLCQGMQVVTVVQGNDDISLLEDFKVMGQTSVQWITDIDNTTAKSRIFEGFPDDLKEEMAHRQLALHFHNYAPSVAKYN